MTDYIVNSPDGKKYRVTAPEGASQDDLLEFVQSQNRGGSGASLGGPALDVGNTHAMPAPPPTAFENRFSYGQRFPGPQPAPSPPTAAPPPPAGAPAGDGMLHRIAQGMDTGPLLEGALQGAVLNPIEAVGQIFEHATNMRIPIPQGVRDWFDNYRRQVQSTTKGTVGEIGGSLMMPASRASISTSLLPRSVQAAARGAKEAVLQPVSSDEKDFWRAKTGQAVSGAIPAGAVTSPLARRAAGLGAYAATHAAGAGAAHAAGHIPYYAFGFYPLHHLARGAMHATEGTLRAASRIAGPTTQRAIGAVAGHRSAGPKRDERKTRKDREDDE